MNRKKINRSNVVCRIIRCSNCNSFNIDYKNVRINVDLNMLIHVLSVVYQYDLIDEETKIEKPFRIKLGSILLTVCKDDYTAFKSVVEEAVFDNIDIPKVQFQNIFTN